MDFDANSARGGVRSTNTDRAERYRIYVFRISQFQTSALGQAAEILKLALFVTARPWRETAERSAFPASKEGSSRPSNRDEIRERVAPARRHLCNRNARELIAKRARVLRLSGNYPTKNARRLTHVVSLLASANDTRRLSRSRTSIAL